MLFNSTPFLIFFTIVYSLYLVLPHRWQNRMLLAASYIFYGWWDWRFLSLILISTLVDYLCGLGIARSTQPSRRRGLLLVSLITNLGLLGIFKYCNFFLDTFARLLEACRIPVSWPHLNIILPVGISFYTFQTLSYTIDIYRGRMRPTTHFGDFALYVAFFPQLVAGPIERARHLLPQILNPRRVTLAGFIEGCHLIAWGLFEKMFVAALLARIVDPVFAPDGSTNGLDILTALYAFAFQIFCDFDAYSNIARGLARCLGIDLMVNFRLPYAACNPREFWQRWHISLSSWLRDYLYIPLGGSRYGPWITACNLMITMLLGGLWHGAAWTFVLWGLYHGLLLTGHRLLFWRGSAPDPDTRPRPVRRMITRLIFFHLVIISWLFFRCGSMAQAGQMLSGLVYHFHWTHESIQLFIRFGLICLPLWLIQIWQWRRDDLMILFKQHWIVQTLIYAIMTYLVIGWGVMKPEEFIYFQF